LAIAALLGYGLGKVMNLRSPAVAFPVVATAGLVMFYVGNATVVVGSERPCFI
jgi:xanthosine utilization system XapX-like protein